MVQFDASKFLARYIEDSSENATRLNEGFLLLESGAAPSSTVDDLFRAAHTIKGSSRMMKQVEISEVAHRIEDVLSALRSGTIKPSRRTISVLLKGSDTICRMLEALSEGQKLSSQTEMLKELSAAASGAVQAPMPAVAPAPVTAAVTVPQVETSAPPPQVVQPETASGVYVAAGQGGEPSKSGGSQVVDDPIKHRNAFIKIPTAKLDNMTNLVGELVNLGRRSRRRIADASRAEKMLRELVFQFRENAEPKAGGEPVQDSFANIKTIHQLVKGVLRNFEEDQTTQGLLTKELHARSFEMRLEPIGDMFRLLKRQVRDLAFALGKEVQVSIKGTETELDRKIIDLMIDPLIHIIRNAIDHGIESPEDRLRAGKSRTGTMAISARYEGDSVIIEVSDDGSGIPLETIRARVVKKNIFSEEQANGMSDAELINLIYMPGFSTAEIVTDTSGRGFGMEIVRKNIIEELKGSITVNTEPGRGTSFYLKLPMSLAIMRVLMVRAAGTLFAIPHSFISELVFLGEDSLVDIGDRKAIKLREQLIPAVCLEDILKIESRFPIKRSERLALISSLSGERAGFIIDDVVEELDALVKPLPQHMRGKSWVSSGIITGSEDIVCLLNIPQLIASVKEVKVSAKRSGIETEKTSKRLLVVDDSISTREIEKSILETQGYTVHLAGDGIEAFEIIHKHRFDLIITDIEMPKMNGFMLTEKIRMDSDNKDVPVILVTSRDGLEDKKRGVKAGANAYIVKGAFEQSNLLETVASLLGE
jgi:chemotaxis protein histidine kinase CheA